MNTLASDRKFIEILKYAAPSMTGAPRGITINFSKPPVKDPGAGYTVGGLAAKDRNGRAIVWIDPESSDQTFFTNLLHELAHCKLHLGTLPRVGDDYINAAPKSQPFPTEAYGPKYAYRETEVDKQIKAWLNWVGEDGHEVLTPAEYNKYADLGSYHLILAVLGKYQDPQPAEPRMVNKVITPDAIRSRINQTQGGTTK